MKNLRIFTMAIAIVAMLIAPVAFADQTWYMDQSRFYNPNPASVLNVSTTYSVLTTDNMVTADASSAGFTLTLPPIKSNGLGGKTYIFKKIDSTRNIITVAASSTDSVANTIEGQSSRVITIQNGYMAVMAVGYNWKVTYETPPFTTDMTTGKFIAYRGAVGRMVSTPTTSLTYTQTDCGSTIAVGTDALTLTLPTAFPGCWFKVINTGANGNNIITLKAASTDAFYGPVYTSATGTVTSTLVTSSTGSTLSNTKATALKGDACTLESPAAAMWMINCTGIWTTI